MMTEEHPKGGILYALRLLGMLPSSATSSPSSSTATTAAASSSWHVTSRRWMKGKGLLFLERGILALLIIILTFESRRRLRSWKTTFSSCLLGLWGARRLFFQSYKRSSSSSLLTAPFLRDDSSPDESHRVDPNAGGGGPFVRHVLLGDRGRARCAWTVRQQFLSHAYCDVTFIVEGRRFPAHRCWVAAFSMPLCAMFKSGMRESQEPAVVLKDTGAEAFELMLDYIYGGPVELNQDNIESVLELSVRFAVTSLVDQCCNFLASAVSDDTACSILILADRYNCRPLRRDTLLFVVAHLPRCLAASPEHFSRLPRSLLVEILGDDAMIHGETVAFQSAVFWLDEKKKRTQGGLTDSLIEEVIAQVRFPYMPAQILVEEVEGHPFMEGEMCKRFILEAYRYQAVLQRANTDQEILSKHEAEMGVRARPRRRHTAAAASTLIDDPNNDNDNDDNNHNYHEGAIIPAAVSQRSGSCANISAAAACHQRYKSLCNESDFFFGGGGVKSEDHTSQAQIDCNGRRTCDV